jgi:carbon-monoxide dehydrogenase large subunit
VVEVEAETGRVVVRRYVVVDDCGRCINPLIVEGQLQGGFAQGIGAAFLEELRYDAGGQLLTASLLDYLLPTAADVPTPELIRRETPAATNPDGMKGVGESGIVGVPAALANAVADALAPLGIEIDQYPLTPQRLWAWLQAVNRA